MGDTKTYGYKEISDNLVSQGIVVVTIQYRLGPFGFLSSGDSRIPGNYGLWDQLEALKFVNKVIDKFDGDKTRITIAGVSAGAGSVSLLSLSEHANDLYSQVLPMSGSAFCQWATQAKGFFGELAEELGLDKDSADIKESLKSKSVSEIQKILKSKVSFDDIQDINLAQFGPRFDGDFFKAKSLKEAVEKAAKKPILIGVCSQEDILYTIASPFFPSKNKFFYLTPEQANNYTKEDMGDFVKAILAKEKYFGGRSDEFVKEVVEFYCAQTENQNPNYNFFFEQFTTILSDLNFNIAALREATLKAENQIPTYFYVHDYNIDVTDTTSEVIRGLGHGGDVVNLFGGLYKPIEVDEAGKKVQKQFVDLIANFIKTGTPSIDSVNVPSITPDSFQYIQLTSEPTIKKDLWKKRMAFWDEMAQKYGFDLVSSQKLDN